MIGNGLPLDARGGIATIEQYQSVPLFQYLLIREDKDDIALTSDTIVDDTIINVSAGHGFTGAAGEMIVLWEDNRYIQAPVKSVNVNAIEIFFPLDKVYTVAGTAVVRGNKNMNVDGSVAPQQFKLQFRNFTSPINVNIILIAMTHPLPGDDGKFGGIAALSNGLFFRLENLVKINLNNIKKNSDFKLYSGKVNYPAGAPAGSEATEVTFNSIEGVGSLIQYNPNNGDINSVYVRDDLTGLDSLEISVVGVYAYQIQ